jgi:hypothetical protein
MKSSLYSNAFINTIIRQVEDEVNQFFEDRDWPDDQDLKDQYTRRALAQLAKDIVRNNIIIKEY